MRTKEKGISLISLIITIIVLLIIAVISIRGVTGGSTLNRSLEGADRARADQIQDQVSQRLTADAITGITNSDEQFLSDLRQAGLLKDGKDGADNKGDIVNTTAQTITITPQGASSSITINYSLDQ